MRIATLYSPIVRPYTGVELRPHFLLTELGLRGTAVGAFIGPCVVKTENLVDWEDRLANDRIEARSMVHFIGEFFESSLREGVLTQRLFIAIIGDSLRELGLTVRRSGDDLFICRGTQAEPGGQRDKKLSVSIVTASPVSQLLHIGINIDPTGAPVAAIGLGELGVTPEEWIPEILKRFAVEWEDLSWACTKVRPVM